MNPAEGHPPRDRKLAAGAASAAKSTRGFPGDGSPHTLPPRAWPGDWLLPRPLFLHPLPAQGSGHGASTQRKPRRCRKTWLLDSRSSFQPPDGIEYLLSSSPPTHVSFDMPTHLPFTPPSPGGMQAPNFFVTPFQNRVRFNR